MNTEMETGSRIDPKPFLGIGAWENSWLGGLEFGMKVLGLGFRFLEFGINGFGLLTRDHGTGS